MKIVTCFSYKGGSGRTVAAANIAAALASVERVGVVEEPLARKVALLDLDVFHRAPGLPGSVAPVEKVSRQGLVVFDEVLTGSRNEGSSDPLDRNHLDGEIETKYWTVSFIH